MDERFKWLQENNWLRGTQISADKTVIVNDSNDEELLDKVSKELDSIKRHCDDGLSRIRVTIEYVNLNP